MRASGISSTAIVLPFGDAAAPAVGIREMVMLAIRKPPLHKIRLMPARETSVSGCSHCKLK